MRAPDSVRVTVLLIGLNAAFWLVYALLVAFGDIPTISANPIMRWFIAGLAFAASACLAALAFFLWRRNQLAFYAAGIVLTAIAVLSLADEVGLPDVATMIVSLLALGLMWKDRRWYVGER